MNRKKNPQSQLLISEFGLEQLPKQSALNVVSKLQGEDMKINIYNLHWVLIFKI